MRDSRVEEVEEISSDSDSCDDSNAARARFAGDSEFTLGIFPNHVQQGPTYLILASKAEKEKWLYHLTVVSGGNPKVGKLDIYWNNCGSVVPGHMSTRGLMSTSTTGSHII